MRKRTAALCTAAITAALAARASAQLVAFPGAQGFGAAATGGRGGSIYVVTNYDSSGPGSFEDAVSGSNRIVVFAVGGYVNMSAAISCGSNLTILGQTAPGQGIAFEGHEISFNNASNDIVQYIRAREGSTDTSAKASINLGGTSNMILDHVDAEFSQYDNIDAVGSPTTTNNITLQNSLIADPIKAQQFNMHTEGSNTTYLNNIFANGEGRSVLAKANSQFVNNVVYDYGYAYTTGNSGGVFSYDIINNDFISGPSTNQKADAFYQLDTNQSAYSSGNLVDGTLTAATSGSSDTMNTLTAEWSPTTKYLPTLSTGAAYNFDVAHAGALYPNGDGTFSRDQVDSQIIGQVQSGGSGGSILNEQDDDGLSNNGFGTLANASAGANTLDTVPFTWLMSHGLSTTNAAQLVLPNALGYDMIEEYAQQIGDQYASQTATHGDWATTTWSATTPGIYDHALIRGTGTANGAVTIGSSDVDSAFTISIGGNGPAAGESLTVSGGSLTVQDTIYVGDQNNGSLTITGGTVRANNVQIGNTVWNANGSSSTTYTGLLTLNGGMLQVGQIVLGGGVAGAWTTGGNVNISGGTIQAISNLFVNAPVTIGAGGATIDTNSFNGSISSIISGPGALTKIGAGVLALSAANSYGGGTNINVGEVGISTDSNIGGATSTINFNGGLLQVNGTSMTNLNSHTVNWSTFNGGFDIAASNNTFTVSQNLGGGGSLTKTGAGTLVLGGASTFTGGVILDAGVLSVSADANLGANGGTLTFNGGTLLVTGTTLTSTTNHPLGTFGGGAFNISNEANTFTIEQQVNGTGTLTKLGPGILVLGTRDYLSGDTYLDGGTLRVGDPLSLRYTTVHLSTAGTTLDLNGISETIGGLTGNQTLDIKGTAPYVGNNNTAQTFSGVLADSSGTGSIHKIGTGIWTLTGNNTFTDPLWISGGDISVVTLNNGGVAGPLGAGTNAAGNLVLDGGALQYASTTAGASTDHLFTLTINGGTLDGSGASGDGMGFTNTGAIAFSGTGNRTLNLIGTETHNSFSSALGDADANSKTSLVMNGTGRWLWESKLSTYSGDTSIVDGTLRLYSGGFLPSGAGKGNVDVNSGGSLVADISTTINGLNNVANGSSGTVTITSGTLTIGAGNASGAFGGVIAGSAIAKTGVGTEILSGANTYTGTTSINGGVLQFNSAASIGGTGASVTITGGAADAAGYAINQAFVARITTASVGSAALAVASTGNLDFSSATGANLPNVSLGAVGNVSFTGTLTPYGNTYRLGGGGGTLTLPNSAQLTGANGVIVTGPGIVASIGQDNYTGTTTVLTGGTFSPVVALGGYNSGMGVSSNAAANLILDGGAFEGTGTTDRSFTLTANGGSIDNSGGLSLTGPGAVALPANSNVTLALTGSSTAHNLFNLSLADPGGGYITSVVKTGTGKWTFSADETKTYSGPTIIVAGQLEALSGDAFSHYSNLIIDSGASLEMHDNNVTINGLQGAGAVYDSFINGTRTLTIGAQNGGGIWSGNINSAATLNVVKTGGGTETWTGANTYVGSTTASGGTLILASGGSVISTALAVNAGAQLNLIGSVPTTATITSQGITDIGPNPNAGIFNYTIGGLGISGAGQVNLLPAALRSNRTLLVTAGLSFAGNTGAWLGRLDMSGNDSVVNNGNLASLTNQVSQGYNGGNWNGSGGITSSAAAADARHLTALGVIQNSTDGTTTGSPLYGTGTILGLFDGYSPVATDVLTKYTWYGDINLDGKVDGTDYSRIDSGYLNQLTGWYNGDFNYDSVVDGSDYTLIDNAFNTQGAALTASVTTQIAASETSVPEPGTIGMIALGVTALRRRARRSGM